MARGSKHYRRLHVPLILLICLTLGAAIYILNAPEKAGTSAARTNFITCSNAATKFISCSLPSVTNGNTLVAVIGTRSSTANAVDSISQTGATWNRATQATNASGNTTEIWYTTGLIVGTSGGTDVTINLANSINASAIITQYSGIMTTGSLDKTANATGTSTTASTGTTTTTSQSNEVWIGGLTVSGTGTFATPTNSFTKITESESTGGLAATRNNTTFLERIVTATAAANSTSTITSAVWSGAIATFNATGAPTQIGFSTTAPSLSAGSCSSAISLETRDSSGAAVYATNGVQIQIFVASGDTPTFYTTSSCTGTSVTIFTFNGTESSKTFYMKSTKSGSYQITATKISGIDTLTDGTLNYSISPGSLSKLGIQMPGQTTTFIAGQAGGSPSTQIAGTGFTITQIRALDAYDNAVTGYSGAKTLTFSGAGTSPNSNAPSYTTAVSFTSGVSTTVLSTTLYKAETGIAISVTEFGFYGSPTPTFSVSAAALLNYGMALSGTAVTAGSCASNTLTISAKDTYGNVRTADTSTVQITTNTTGMTFYATSACSGSSTSFVLASGTITIYWLPTKKAASATITATKLSDTPTGTSSAINISPAAVNTILVKLPGQSFTDGTGISGSVSFTGLRTPNATAGTSFTVTLHAIDSYYNLVDSGSNNYTGAKTISWANSTAGNSPGGTAATFPTTSVTFSNGASTTTLTAIYYNATTSRTVRADDNTNSISGATSTGFTVQSQVVSNYGLSATTPQIAGVAFNVTVTARDTYNNALGSLYTAPAGTYILSSTATNAPDTTAPSIGTLTQANFTSGVATKSVTLYKAESVTFTASEPSPSVITGTSSATLINPGSISANTSDSTVTGNATGYSYYNQTITITLKDTWRNPIPSVDKSYIIVSGTGSPTIVQPAANTNASGVATSVVTWASAGSYTVSVTIATATLVQNDGATVDADGKLDQTLAVTISDLASVSSRVVGGSTIRGGSTLR